jgi:hypothetical protein
MVPCSITIVAEESEGLLFFQKMNSNFVIVAV